uniref:Ixodidin n=1 Tax=Ornithodoros coriaceus TaxID=92741 RepID=B2D258_ORNCO|nr:ixodidin [Ornithodoros coriaceus]
MKTAVVFIATFAFLAAAGTAKRRLGYHDCHHGAVYSYCASPCPRVCGEPPVTNCGRRCVEGCTCLQGRLLDPLRHRCILEETCQRFFLRNETQAPPVSNAEES